MSLPDELLDAKIQQPGRIYADRNEKTGAWLDGDEVEQFIQDMMALAALPDHAASEPLSRFLHPDDCPCPEPEVFIRLAAQGLCEAVEGPGWLRRTEEGDRRVRHYYRKRLGSVPKTRMHTP